MNTHYASAVGVEAGALGLCMQFRDESIAAEQTVSADDASDDSRMWYVRLRIRDDRLAKLWVWKLAEHDVIVWSEPEECWKKLLAVPELRTAVRKATTSAYARKTPSSEAPPKPEARRRLESIADADAPTTARRRMESLADEDAPPTKTRRRMESLADLDFDEQPTQACLPLRKTTGRDVEQAPTRTRPRTPSVPPPRPANPFLQSLPQRPVSEPPPRPVDPFLHALTTSIPPAFTTSIPPAVHSTRAPEIPRAPRLPSFIDHAPVPPNAPAARVLTLVQPQQPVRVVTRAVSQFSVRNISWAMVPIACAGVFAMYLDRNPIGYEPMSGAARQSGAPVRGVSMLGDYDLTGERFAALLKGAMPVCSGQPSANESSSVISPEQLAAIPNTSTRTSGSVWRNVKPTTGAFAVARKFGDKGGIQSTSSGATAAADNNEFDRDGARTALKFAIARVRNCSNSGLSGSALITFATGGTVQNVQLAQLVGDDVDPSCVTRALSGARVPPFTGSPVTVRKAF